MDYAEHYAIQASLGDEENLIPAARLFDLDAEALYSSGMELLAASLPSGRDSPFSNKATGSNHSILMGALCHMVEVLGFEIDKMPDRAWINFFRLLGVEQQTGNYPTIEVKFTRSATSVARNLTVDIPIGTEIQNIFDSAKSAYLTESVTIEGSATSVTAIARVDTLGEDLNTQIGSYSRVVAKIPFLESVTDVGYVSSGGEPQTLADSIILARQGIRTGNLGRLYEFGLIDLDGERFLGRCVTLRDYIFYAQRLGAAKANAVQGKAFGASGYYGDLITIPVYPPVVAGNVGTNLALISDASARVDVIPAQIIPIDGIVDIKIAQNLPRQVAINKIIDLIVDKINPPYGRWGDKELATTMSSAIEQIEGVYAVPSILLKNANNGIPLEGLQIEPWHLFEVQDSLEINVV